MQDEAPIDLSPGHREQHILGEKRAKVPDECSWSYLHLCGITSASHRSHPRGV